MKQAIKKVKIITTGAILVFLLGFTSPVFSTDTTGSPIELKFTGKFDQGARFQLKMNNAESDVFLIQLKDIGGNIIHSEKLSGKNVLRNYKVVIDPEFYQEFKVTFEITSKLTKETLIYNVSNTMKATNDVIIAKL